MARLIDLIQIKIGWQPARCRWDRQYGPNFRSAQERHAAKERYCFSLATRGRQPACLVRPIPFGCAVNEVRERSLWPFPFNPAGVMKLSGGNFPLSLVVLAHYVAAPPDRLDVVLATRCVGQFFPQLADEDVDDLHLRLVQAAIEVAQKHFLS
jgi:hypothetical protein